MDDLTYEFQRMTSRRAEIQAAIKKDGVQAAWEAYSRVHDLTPQRFRKELPTLKARFESMA